MKISKSTWIIISAVCLVLAARGGWHLSRLITDHMNSPPREPAHTRLGQKLLKLLANHDNWEVTGSSPAGLILMPDKEFSLQLNCCPDGQPKGDRSRLEVFVFFRGQCLDHKLTDDDRRAILDRGSQLLATRFREAEEKLAADMEAVFKKVRYQVPDPEKPHVKVLPVKVLPAQSFIKVQDREYSHDARDWQGLGR